MVSSDITTTELERTSLEAHVDLCAMRYKQLDTRLTILEAKMDAISQTINASSDSMKTVIITSTATIVASLGGVIIAIIMKF